MDKGYDSEKIHFIIKEEIKADSIIPVREKKRKKISGKYEKLLTLVFDKIKYNQRNIVETLFSVAKKIRRSTKGKKIPLSSKRDSN